MEFTEIKKIVIEDSNTRKENRAFYILNGYMPTWAEEHRTDSDRGLKDYSTETRWTQYTRGEITREKAVELATKRALKSIEKDTAAELARATGAKPQAVDALTVKYAAMVPGMVQYLILRAALVLRVSGKS